MSDIAVWTSIAQNVVSAIALAVGAYVAWTGLNTWKEQIRANAEYDLARRVLKAVYKLRDAIEGARLVTVAYEDREKTKKIHETLMPKVDDAKASLDVELLEAEAVWGDEHAYRAALSAFRSRVTLFRVAYQEYYSPRPTNISESYQILFIEPIAQELLEEELALVPEREVYVRDFARDLEKAVKRLEDVLRPKLRLKQGKARRKKWAWPFKRPPKPKRP